MIVFIVDCQAFIKNLVKRTNHRTSHSANKQEMTPPVYIYILLSCQKILKIYQMKNDLLFYFIQLFPLIRRNCLKRIY